MRIPPRFLEHKATIRRRLPIPSVDGDRYAAAESIPCIVIERQKLVVDQRADSGTYNQQIVSSTRILAQPEIIMPPGSLITIWIGDAREATVEVVSTAYGRHSIAPASSQAWCA